MEENPNSIGEILTLKKGEFRNSIEVRFPWMKLSYHDAKSLKAMED